MNESYTTSAQVHLATYGIGIDEASSFILSNIDNIELIYNTCKTYGVTNDMVAEILQPTYPGLGGVEVANYFALHGIDSTDLGGSLPTVAIVNTTPVSESNGTDLGIGIPIFVKTKEIYSSAHQTDSSVDTTNFSISYDATSNQIIQVANDDYSTYNLLLEFDSNGNIIKEINGTIVTTFTYDGNNRVIEKAVASDGEIGHQYNYSYGDDTVTVFAINNFGGYTDTAIGTLNSNGNIVSLQWESGWDSDEVVDKIEYFTYDENGNVLTQTIDGDIYALDGVIDETYTYEWGLFT